MLSQTFWLPSFLRNKSRWRQMSLIGVWPSLPWATNANTARTFCLPMLPAQCSPLYGWTIGRDQTWMLVSEGASTGGNHLEETKFGETIWVLTTWEFENCQTRREKSHLDPGSIGRHHFFRRHHWERNHWEMGNVSLWGRVTFGARAIERRQSGGESGAREAIVLHPGDISCTHHNHTWLEHIFMENFTTIIDEANLLHTNKQLYLKSTFWSQGRICNCNAKKIQSFCWHSVLPNTKKTQLHNLAFQHGAPYKQCPGCQEEKCFLIRLVLTLLGWGQPISKCQYPLVIEKVSNWASPAQNSDEWWLVGSEAFGTSTAKTDLRQ